MTPKIYVGTYAKYNNGSTVGAWLNCEYYSDWDEFMGAAAELHNDEEDPELMFQDWEDIPSDWVSEIYVSHDLWEAIHHRWDSDALAKVCGFQEAYGFLSSRVDQMVESCVGEARTEGEFEDYILERFYDCNEVPQHLEHYIDEAAIFRDYKMEYTMCGGYIYDDHWS